MNDPIVFIKTVGLIFIFMFGWILGHSTVAHECKKLGGFYVGSTIYECKVKETKNE